MKLRLTFKTPNVDYPLVQWAGGPIEVFEEIKNLVNRFVKYDEYVTIEFDTETQTATVIPL